MSHDPAAGDGAAAKSRSSSKRAKRNSVKEFAEQAKRKWPNASTPPQTATVFPAGRAKKHGSMREGKMVTLKAAGGHQEVPIGVLYPSVICPLNDRNLLCTTANLLSWLSGCPALSIRPLLKCVALSCWIKCKPLVTIMQHVWVLDAH